MFDKYSDELIFFVLVDFDKLKDYPTKTNALSMWEEGRRLYLKLNDDEKLSLNASYPNLDDKLPYIN